MTPEGVKRAEAVAGGESVAAKAGRTLDYVIVGGLALVMALVIWQGTRTDKLSVITDVSPSSPQLINPPTVPTAPAKSIAVLPFADMSAEGDQVRITVQLIEVSDGFHLWSETDADTLSAGAMANFLSLGMIDELFEVAPNNIANTDWVTGNIWMNDPSAQAVRQHPDFPQFTEDMGFLGFWQTYGWPDLCRPDLGTDGSDGRFKCD